MSIGKVEGNETPANALTTFWGSKVLTSYYEQPGHIPMSEKVEVALRKTSNKAPQFLGCILIMSQPLSDAGNIVVRKSERDIDK